VNSAYDLIEGLKKRAVRQWETGEVRDLVKYWAGILAHHTEKYIQTAPTHHGINYPIFLTLVLEQYNKAVYDEQNRELELMR